VHLPFQSLTGTGLSGWGSRRREPSGWSRVVRVVLGARPCCNRMCHAGEVPMASV